MPKVVLKQDKDVFYKLELDAGPPGDIGVKHFFESGTDFNGDGKLDLNSTVRSAESTTMGLVKMGRGDELQDFIVDILVKYKLSAGATAKKLTAKLVQDGNVIGEAERTFASFPAPGPLLFRFWS
jgi:hypothetical protein